MATIKEIEEEIADYKLLLDEPSVPQDEKDFAKEEIAELEAELEKLKPKKKPSKSSSQLNYEKERKRQIDEGIIDDKIEGISILGMSQRGKSDKPKKPTPPNLKSQTPKGWKFTKTTTSSGTFSKGDIEVTVLKKGDKYAVKRKGSNSKPEITDFEFVELAVIKKGSAHLKPDPEFKKDDLVSILGAGSHKVKAREMGLNTHNVFTWFYSLPTHGKSLVLESRLKLVNRPKPEIKKEAAPTKTAEDKDCDDKIDLYLEKLKDKKAKQQKDNRDKPHPINDDLSNRSLLYLKAVIKKQKKDGDVNVSDIEGFAKKLTELLTYAKNKFSSVKSDKFIKDFEKQATELVKTLRDD